MEKENKQNTIETYKIPEAGSKEEPVLFGDNVEDLRGLSFIVENGSEEPTEAFGNYLGYYTNEKGDRSDLVSYGDPEDIIEVAGGEAVRSLSGKFMNGELVIVARSDGSIDGDWTVADSTVGKKGEKRTTVIKPNEDGNVMTKSVTTEELRKLNQSDVNLSGLEFDVETTELEERRSKQRAALANQAIKRTL